MATTRRRNILGHAYPGEHMNRNQIAQIYDDMTPEQQNMSRAEFIKQTLDALDPAKMMQEAEAIAHGRIQRKQIDEALK